jgi:hypothetical protein
MSKRAKSSHEKAFSRGNTLAARFGIAFAEAGQVPKQHQVHAQIIRATNALTNCSQA